MLHALSTQWAEPVDYAARPSCRRTGESQNRNSPVITSAPPSVGGRVHTRRRFLRAKQVQRQSKGDDAPNTGRRQHRPRQGSARPKTSTRCTGRRYRCARWVVRHPPLPFRARDQRAVWLASKTTKAKLAVFIIADADEGRYATGAHYQRRAAVCGTHGAQRHRRSRFARLRLWREGGRRLRARFDADLHNGRCRQPVSAGQGQQVGVGEADQTNNPPAWGGAFAIRSEA